MPLCGAGRIGKPQTVDAPIIRQGEIGTSKIYLKQTIDPCGAEAVTEFQP